MRSKLLPLQKNRDHDVDLMKGILVVMLALFIATLHVNGQTDVTAAQVNGIWKYRENEFKVWALGEQKLQIEFSGIYEYKTGDGERTANTGEGSGIAKIEGDTAIFKPEGAEDECKITLKFSGGKLVVSQQGICGFGFNVRADGTYKKVSSKKPKFDS